MISENNRAEPEGESAWEGYVAPHKVPLGAGENVHDLYLYFWYFNHVFKIKTQINRLRRHGDLIITLSFTKQFDTTLTRAYEQFYDFIKVASIK